MFNQKIDTTIETIGKEPSYRIASSNPNCVWGWGCSSSTLFNDKKSIEELKMLDGNKTKDNQPDEKANESIIINTNNR